MKRIFAVLCNILLTFVLIACNNSNNEVSPALPVSQTSIIDLPTISALKYTLSSEQANNDMKIQIVSETGNIIVFELNKSTAAQELYHQLPLVVEVTNYSSNKKIFYQPEKLTVENTPITDGSAGTLAYYEPWGNVAIYYRDGGIASGLYELGDVISGLDYISEMTGKIRIEVAETLPPLSKSISSEKNIVDEEVKKVANIQVTIGTKNFTATLEDNAAAYTFVEMMKNAPVVINMSDYGGFEKVGSLGTSLPTSNSNITANEGDIILYNGNQIVVFYGSNSWSYTRLGKIDDLSGWKEALDDGDITITFSIK